MKDNCLEIEPLLAAYALEALEITERDLVEEHLETCADCRRVLDDYLAVSDGLQAALPPVAPPERLRARLLTQTAPKQPKSGWLESLRSIQMQIVPALGLITILILAIINISLVQRTNQIMDMQESLAQQNRGYQTALALLTYPESQVAVIDDANISGTLVYDPDGQVAVLNVWGLDELPKDQDYQLWLIEPDQSRISGGVFGSTVHDGYISFVIESPQRLNTFTGIGVTIEPKGGSTGPTGPRVFGIQL